MSEIPRLSVLDATPIGPGVTARQALSWTADVARLTEDLHYHRMWVVEHHSSYDIGCSTPAVLIAHLAALTRRLRIGAGGVMLPNHAPFVIAEQFRMLQGLYPDRIDLGVGRARSADPAINLALQRPNPNDFELELEDLNRFLGGDFPAGHAFENVRISIEAGAPPVYLLGSGVSSATLAAERGLPFAFAHHLNPSASGAAVGEYKLSFRANGTGRKPHAIVTVAVVCADSMEEARQAALKAAVVRLRRAAVVKRSLRVSSEALLFPRWTNAERVLAEKELAGGWVLVGDAERVGDGLRELQRSTGADELMLTTIEYDGPSRMRTLRSVGMLNPQTALAM